jgi:hypothetical protein
MFAFVMIFARILNLPHIGKADLGDAVAQIRVVAVSRVEQCDVGLDPGRASGTKLVECDLRFGLEDDIVRHACLSAPGWVISPFMRQIQAIGDRQAGVIVRGRQADRDLAVVLFAKLPTILSRHADRVLAFLRHAGVIDDQGPDRATSPNDVMTGSTRARTAPSTASSDQAAWLHARSYRFDALALSGQQQPRAIRSERRYTIGMAKRRRDRLDIGGKP